MNGRTDKLVKNTVILGFGQFLPRITALVTLPILTAALSTSDYGIYDLILTAESLLMPLMTLQIQQGIFRKLIQFGIEKKQKILSSAYSFLGISLAIWCPIIILIFYLGFNYSIPITLIIYGFYVSYSLFDVFGQSIRGIGFNSKYSIGILVYSVINMSFIVILFLYNSITVISVFVASFLAYIISCFYYIISAKLFRGFSFQYCDKDTIKSLLGYSIPIIPSSIALWIVNLSDRVLVTLFLGTSMNGIYSVANRIPNLFASVYSVFNLAWTETASRVMDKDSDSDKYYSKMFDALFRFLSGAMLLLISISPLLFKLLINRQFDEAFEQMPILFMGVFFNCIVSFYGGIYVAKQKTRQVGLSSAAGALLNAVINILMIHSFGLYAASVSTVVSFAVIAIYRYFDLKKYVKIHYSYRLIILCLALMIIYCVLCARRNVALDVIMFAIAIIWNLLFNKSLIKWGLSRVKRINR